MSLTRPIDGGWLAQRRAADSQARDASVPLVRQLAERIGPTSQLSFVDLGAGTGANPAWLAPRVHQAFLDRHGAAPDQHWLLLDHDPDLLAARDVGQIAGVATCRSMVASVEGFAAAVAGQTRPVVVTCSALLDLLTGSQIQQLVEGVTHCADAALLALTVTGDVRLRPDHHDDNLIWSIFNDHQQRALAAASDTHQQPMLHTDGADSSLAGPRGWEVAAAALGKGGWQTRERHTPWTLGPAQTSLLRRWLGERVEAALEHLTEADPRSQTVRAWLADRLGQIERGELQAEVGHVDGLALPSPAHPSRPT